MTRQAEKREKEKGKNEDFDHKKIPYHNAIGSLLYLANACRPDIAYAVYALSKKCNNFDKNDWVAVKQIF